MDVHEECVRAAKERRDALVAAVSLQPVREEARRRLQREGRWDAFAERYAVRVDTETVGGDEDLKIWDDLMETEFKPLPKDKLPKKVQDEVDGLDKELLRDPVAEDQIASTKGNKGRAKRKAKRPAKNPKVDIRGVVEWVFANIGKTSAEAGDEPFAGARQLLERVNADHKMQDWFYTQMFVKLLPTRAQVEGDGRFRDNNQNLVEFFDRIVRSHGYEPEAEEE